MLTSGHAQPVFRGVVCPKSGQLKARSQTCLVDANHQAAPSLDVIALRVVLRCFVLLLHNRPVPRSIAGWWGAVRGRSGGLRDRDGVPVQSTAELAGSTAGLGSFARLAAFAGMACASPRVATMD
jgi:hypothetical protein